MDKSQDSQLVPDRRERDFLLKSLQQESTLANSSLEAKLQQLKEFTENPWFGYFMMQAREHGETAQTAVLKTTPGSVESFFQREQAFGEIVGCQHFQQDYFDVVDALLDEREKRNNPQPEGDKNE